uniref:Uncharacterized protein n=1 Tax=Lepeophtheirus salmonis TaxID=72036 RepID=A0A0K2T691_LEPSM
MNMNPSFSTPFPPPSAAKDNNTDTTLMLTTTAKSFTFVFPLKMTPDSSLKPLTSALSVETKPSLINKPSLVTTSMMLSPVTRLLLYTTLLNLAKSLTNFNMFPSIFFFFFLRKKNILPCIPFNPFPLFNFPQDLIVHTVP